MDGEVAGRLVGSDIHGFHTSQELDIPTMMEEVKTRWLRPNEIHAILYNHKCFTVNVKPVHLPKSGTIVLFDRKMLRNFRKDGHNWKKKKDGKTVKEAHEHLKVGNEERIHVYYAHGEDNPTFVRRCYWLLDKTMEHIVLVHYRETQEVQESPATPVNSNSSSISDHLGPRPVVEDTDSGSRNQHYMQKESLGSGDSLDVRNHEIRLHELQTLEWHELLESSYLNNSAAPVVDNVFNQQLQISVNGSMRGENAYDDSANISSYGSLSDPSNGFYVPESISVQPMSSLQKRDSNAVFTSESLDAFVNGSLQSQNSFGEWMNSIISDSPGSVNNHSLEAANSPGQDSSASPSSYHLQSSMPEQVFSITDVSPTCAYLTETTKILVTGFFHEGYQHLGKSDIYCVCGDVCVPAKYLQVGVYRCFLSPHSPGIVNFYLSSDGHKPISQVLNFENRSAISQEPVVSEEGKSKWEEFQFQLRLAHLLFTSSKNLNVLAGKVSSRGLLVAKKFVDKTSHLSTSWAYLMKSVEENQILFEQAKDNLFEITLKNRLKEWLGEKVLEGCETTEYDSKGQGVIHLCAILGYTWSVHLFSWSGLSLNFRDKHGWTALHWAAYYEREKMVAALLSAGARPNLVTDPTKENPGGYTAADLASEKGYDGLAAYLSEKSLVAHFEDMKIAGNISGTLQTNTTDTTIPQNITEEEQDLKDTLAAYRTAAEAASRIHVAFREHALTVRTKAAQFASPEEEARNIVSVLKIQHAFRNYETRKRMVAAARIQHRFQTWKMQREFRNMRRQAVKIQAAFRGYRERRQYSKIIWSVGVLEKAILRWRLKRKGFRGLQVDPLGEAAAQNQGSDTEEDFYKMSQKQAENRLETSVVKVQAMFRSKKAQQDYRRMKLAHEQALMEYGSLQELDMAMES